MFVILRDILSHLNYLFISIVVAFVVFVLLVLSSNAQLIVSIISYSHVGILTKAWIIINLLGSIQTNFSIFSIFSITTVSILFGINISAIYYIIKEFGGVLYDKSVVGTGGGMLVAILGGGCASCGTLVITPLLSLIGLGGILSFLPFKGQEFNVLSIILLLISLFVVLRKIKISKEVFNG